MRYSPAIQWYRYPARSGTLKVLSRVRDDPQGGKRPRSAPAVPVAWQRSPGLRAAGPGAWGDETAGTGASPRSGDADRNGAPAGEHRARSPHHLWLISADVSAVEGRAPTAQCGPAPDWTSVCTLLAASSV